MQHFVPNSFFESLMLGPAAMLPSIFNPNLSVNPPGNSYPAVVQPPRTPLHQRFSSNQNAVAGTENRFAILPCEYPAPVERFAGTFSLPVKESRQIIDLELALSSIQQYECLVGHLQAMTLRHNGALTDMFRNLFDDSIIMRLEMATHANGPKDSINLSEYLRIMSALKCAWFPDKDQNTFRLQLEALIKSTQSECLAVERLNQQPPHGDEPGADRQQLLDQWHQYAIYYRDRYRVVKKENQKIRASYKATKRRVSRCMTKMQGMELQMNLLEYQLREDGGLLAGNSH